MRYTKSWSTKKKRDRISLIKTKKISDYSLEDYLFLLEQAELGIDLKDKQDQEKRPKNGGLVSL